MVTGVAALAAVAAIGACSNSATKEATSSAAPSTAQTSTSAAPAAAHNQADMRFARMMIPHHQQAIEMSDMILAKDGIDPQVAELAQQIKDAQAPEITQMRGWLAGWGENPSPSMGGMDGMDHGMGGTMTEAEMDALEEATGTDAARLFLTGMVKHHQGAITMAEQELAEGENPAAKQLAQTIVDTQQAEITTMNELLSQL